MALTKKKKEESPVLRLKTDIAGKLLSTAAQIGQFDKDEQEKDILKEYTTLQLKMARRNCSSAFIEDSNQEGLLAVFEFKDKSYLSFLIVGTI